MLALALAPSGCASQDKPVAVRGVVTQDGKPVPGATVLFVPEGPDGRPANGLTDNDGAFQLTTFQKGDGALRGDYRVVVSKTEPRNWGGPALTQVYDAQKKKKTQPASYYRKVRATAAKPGKPLLPAVYREAGQTPLRCRVPADGKVTLELRNGGGAARQKR